MAGTSLSYDRKPASGIKNSTNDEAQQKERITMTKHITGTREEWSWLKRKTQLSCTVSNDKH